MDSSMRWRRLQLVQLCVLLVMLAGAINGLRCRTDEEASSEEDYREAVRVCMSNVTNDWEYAATNDDRGGRRPDQRKNYNRGHGYYPGGGSSGEEDDRGGGGRRGSGSVYTSGGTYGGGGYGGSYGGAYGGGGYGAGGGGGYGNYGGGGGGRRGNHGSRGGPTYHSSSDGDEYGDGENRQGGRGGSYGSGGGMCEAGGGGGSGNGGMMGGNSGSNNGGGSGSMGGGSGGGGSGGGGQQGQRKGNRGGRPRTRRATYPARGDRRGGYRGSSSKSTLDQVDACIVHCIFRQMKMVNENSRPDKGSVMTVMTQYIRDTDLKDFIQESIDECFDILQSDSRGGKCDFAKNLALCLEEKGRRSCDDWDEEQSSGKGDMRGDHSPSSQQHPSRQHYVRGR